MQVIERLLKLLFMVSVRLLEPTMLFLLTESPDIVKCLTNIAKLCFPDNGRDLLTHDDGRCATSPLSLIAMFQRLQHLVSGGSMLALCCLLFAITVVYLQLNEHH